MFERFSFKQSLFERSAKLLSDMQVLWDVLSIHPVQLKDFVSEPSIKLPRVSLYWLKIGTISEFFTPTLLPISQTIS